MRWRIRAIRGVAASPERDTAGGAVVDLERDGETRRIIVELADTARVSGMTLDARSAVREFLTQEETPSRLIVTTHGVRVAE